METNDKICIFCKKQIVGNKKIPVCQSCRDKGKDAGKKAGEVVLGVGAVSAAVIKILINRDN